MTIITPYIRIENAPDREHHTLVLPKDDKRPVQMPQ